MGTAATGDRWRQFSIGVYTRAGHVCRPVFPSGMMNPEVGKMSTPEVQRDPIEAGGFPLETQVPDNSVDQGGVGISAAARPRRAFDWLDYAFYAIGGVVGIGFLMVLFGAYLVPNLVVILVGTIIVIVGVVAWIIAALLMIAIMLKSLFSRGGRTIGPHQTR